jgi:hypothetical protein
MTVFEQRTHEAVQELNRKIPELKLRDLFAMSIIQTQVKDCLYDDDEIKGMAEQSYRIADAMLEARGK